MNRYFHRILKPVRRPRANSYLLVTLFAFAFTVSATRLFLEVTGYPQLGGEDLHIAHVLWGGLLLTIAAILPLVIANRWVYQFTAVLAGVGAGLFMDEVGKFISQENDYFFPIAAPIIYAFFILGVFFYLRINSPPPQSVRGELYAVLELLEEYLDHDLDSQEFNEVIDRLNYAVDHDDPPHLARFAASLSSFLKGNDIDLAPEIPKKAERLQASLRSLEERFLDQNRLRTWLSLGTIVLGSFATLTSIIAILATFTPPGLLRFLTALFNPANIGEIRWFLATHALQGTIGIMLIGSGVSIAKHRQRVGFALAYYSLIVYLIIVDLMLFYYYQFSTIISALVQFSLLIGLIHFRNRYYK